MTNFFKKWKGYLTFAALLSCFVNILQLTFPFYMFSIYRNIVISFSSISLANITFVAFFALIVLGIFYFIRARLLAKAGDDLSLTLRDEVFSVMVKGSALDPKFAYTSGLHDLEILRKFLSSSSVCAIFDAPWAPFYLILIFLVDPLLGFIATIGAIAMVFLNIIQQILVGKSMKEANLIYKKNKHFTDSFFRNIEVVNGMGMIDSVSDRYIAGNKQVMLKQTRSSNIAGTIQALLKPMQNLIQVGIYCAGAYYGIMKGFNIGLIVAASIIMGRGVAPLMRLASSWQFTGQAYDAYRRLSKIMLAIQQQKQPMPLPPPKGLLEVKEATCLTRGRTLLGGVSFTLQPGEHLAVLGPNGAGKTTLCRLLLGIWPSTAGKIYLDGMDIFACDKEQIGPYLGYVPQQIELFPGTIAENITRFGPGEKGKIDEAVKLSGLVSLLDQLPDGLATQLEGQGGIRLSGGQKQKIGLARALYGRPRFVVLDEPTSNLDSDSEMQLVNTLAHLKQRKFCTCVMVTHKLSLLQSSDKVLVLQDGRASLFGPTKYVVDELAKRQADLRSS